MSVILSVYSKDAFKEFLLPATDNADFTMTLDRELFALSENVDVSLEIIDGDWRICSSNQFKIRWKTKKTQRKDILQDGDVLTLKLPDENEISIVVNFFDAAFCPFRKYDVKNISGITIGKDASNIFCYQNMNLVSRKHAILYNNRNTFIVEDCSSNGCFLNGKRIRKRCTLEYGDMLEIFGLKIMYLEDFLAVRSLNGALKIPEGALREYKERKEAPREDAEYNFGDRNTFHRSPRNIVQLVDSRIQLEAPPTRREVGTRPAILTIGPSITMALPMLLGCILAIYGSQLNNQSAGLFMYTGIVTAVTSAIIGTMWSILNMRYEKKKGAKEEAIRKKSYIEYLREKECEIKKLYDRNSNILRDRYPDAARCCGYDIDSYELWNRNQRHKDFLSERLGLGSLPFQVQIEIPKERFSIVTDELKNRPTQIFNRYKYMREVPICVDLMKHRIIGIIGNREKNGCYDVLNTLIAQIAANNCYVDVKLAFVFDGIKNEESSVLRYARWLPHVWSGDKKWRYVAGEKQEISEILYELVKILRSRASETDRSRKKQVWKPHYVLIVDRPELLEGELISKYVFDTTGDYGLTTIFLTESYEELPNSCEFIIENTEYFRGIYTTNAEEEEKNRIEFDYASPEALEQFARRLSSIVVNEVEHGDEIPNSLSFFEMHGIESAADLKIADRWKKNRTYESMKALIGEKAGGANCFLDIHEKYHGPHGLVAGTTGSGKSELLQTLILSLAVNYSPDDINFFIIDYKGGGMANLFNNLPHLIGSISNLSGNQVHRAMVSIKSENLRRERIFNEYGVNNINQYTRLYKSNEAAIPVPHLIIIIDEFAELKREEPEFMRELISVAQVGRSLGVHLILATQKPSGTVDENIWSNSKFKLCLRVQDKHDSNDMLHRPDAAYLTQAGRCFLQVGNDEINELFQSGFSGAVFDENGFSNAGNIAEMLLTNGRAALIGSHVKFSQKEQVRERWISRIIAMLEQQIEDLDYSLDECEYDSDVQRDLTEKMYRLMQQMSIEYAESKSNSQRLLDLIISYAAVRKMESEDANSRNELIAKRVMKFANENGRALPEKKEHTQLEVVVEEINRNVKSLGYGNNYALWLPVLPTSIVLNGLQGYNEHCFDGTCWKNRKNESGLETMVGLYDDPENQSQQPLNLDIMRNGNCAVLGGSVSGKSTFLLSYLYSLVNRYSADAVNVYALDFSGGLLRCLKEAPHVGGVVTDSEPEQAERLFTMLKKMMVERKASLQKKNGGSEKVPAILLVIDNIGAMRTTTNSKYDEVLLTLLKEGQKYRMYVLASAMNYSIKEIPSGMRDCFGTTICMEMPDKYAYSDSFRTMHLDVIPEGNIKGRGLAKVGESYLEFQTALPVYPEGSESMEETIQAACAQMNTAWDGWKARKIPFIPEKPVASEFFALDECRDILKSTDALPVGYGRKDASVYGIDLRKTYCYMVSGKNHTGKSNLMRIALKSAGDMDSEIAVIDFSGEYEYYTGLVGARYIQTLEEMRAYFLELIPKFKERYQLKKNCIARGMSEEEIYEEMQRFPKLFIFLWDLADFLMLAENPGDKDGPIAPFLSNLFDRGKTLNVFWIAEFNQDKYSKISRLDTYSAFARDGKGVHFGGRVTEQYAFNFDNLTYTERSKSMKPGIGMLSNPEEEGIAEIVVPLNDIRGEQSGKKK